METVKLEEMIGGALQEQFSKSFAKVVENLADRNTPYKDKRKIVIELGFTQNEERDDVSCSVKVSEKLAAQNPITTAFAVGRNLKTGEYYAEEYGRHNHLKGQMEIEEPAPVVVDNSTGEVIEQKATVIDMRKAAMG